MGTGLLTATGYDPKRLEDVLAALDVAMRSEFGQSMNLDPDTPEGKLNGIWAAALTDLWELSEAIDQGQYPAGASGVALDRLAELTGINRRDAIRSTATAYLRGAGATLPVGTLMGVADAGDQFRTLVEATIPASGDIPLATGTTGISITSISRSGTVASVTTAAPHGLVAGAVVTISGAAESPYNVTAEIENIGASTFDYNMVSDPGGSATGTLVYQDEGLASDHITFATAVARSVAHGLITGDIVFVHDADQDGYNGLVTVTVLDVDHFEYAFVSTPTVTPATGSYNADESTPVAVESVQTGPIPALAYTLTDIVNPVSGWDAVSNLTDADAGLDEETDAEFRVRRLAALQGLGNATPDAIRGDLLIVEGVLSVTVFENGTDVTDGGGRPPHSIECLVDGGATVDIAQAIWDSKAGGIATFGGVSDAATDNQGTSHTMNFSRPTDIDIYLDITLTVDGDYPADGDAQVEAAVLLYATDLLIGEDVIVYPYLVGSFQDIPGILTVVIDIGTSPAPSGDANIAIAETERAKFDSGNLTVSS